MAIIASSTMNTIHEKLLIYRIRSKRDPEAFGELYDRYIDKIFRFAALKVSSREVAEDIASEVFLKAWEYLTEKESKTVSSFSGLVYAIARNLVIDHYRKKQKTQEQSLDETEPIAIEDPGLQQVVHASNAEGLLKTIHKMKQEYKEIIILRHVDDLSISEIGDITNRTTTNTRVTLHRAMKVLKKLLEEEGENV